MSNVLLKAVGDLRKIGWDVKLLNALHSLPPAIGTRYSWVPKDLIRLVEGVDVAVSKDEKVWLVAVKDFDGSSGSAFTWDEWERQSLDALDANDDPALRSGIIDFWDAHFPIMISVRSGYSYLAIEKDSLAVVEGNEPEYEECSPVSASFSEFLRDLARPGSKLSRWA